MTPRDGSPIVSVHPGIPLSLQAALLSAVEGVLTDAGAGRVWIEPTADGLLRVHAAALPEDADGFDDSSVAGLALLEELAEETGLIGLAQVDEVGAVPEAPGLPESPGLADAGGVADATEQSE